MLCSPSTHGISSCQQHCPSPDDGEEEQLSLSPARMAPDYALQANGKHK